MVTSVKPAACNPYYDGFEDEKMDFLLQVRVTVQSSVVRMLLRYGNRTAPIYVINPKSLIEKCLVHFTKIQEILMSDIYSVDIDNPFDWKIAELILSEKMVEL